MHALQTITADVLHWVWDEFDYRVDVSCDPGCTHWRNVINAWETWKVAAADDVRCARVRWEINLFLTFETAPFFCLYPVQNQQVNVFPYFYYSTYYNNTLTPTENFDT